MPYYDLHIHTCLSPCGDTDMTPNNVVNMAAIKGLDVIAVTDHNTCKNCGAFMEVAGEVGIRVLPGMELCTAEDIHVVCIFGELKNAMRFDSYVYERTPEVANKPEIFGEQVIMDAQDTVTGYESRLLVTASFISIDDVPSLMDEFNGAAFPAHIDRTSYSVLSSFGFFPPELRFDTVETTASADIAELKRKNPALAGKRFIVNSDAHYLENINEPVNFLSTEELKEMLRLSDL